MKRYSDLFGGGRTTALTNTIKGFDDFELIASSSLKGTVHDPVCLAQDSGL